MPSERARLATARAARRGDCIPFLIPRLPLDMGFIRAFRATCHRGRGTGCVGEAACGVIGASLGCARRRSVAASLSEECMTGPEQDRRIGRRGDHAGTLPTLTLLLAVALGLGACAESSAPPKASASAATASATAGSEQSSQAVGESAAAAANAKPATGTTEAASSADASAGSASEAGEASAATATGAAPATAAAAPPPPVPATTAEAAPPPAPAAPEPAPQPAPQTTTEAAPPPAPAESAPPAAAAGGLEPPGAPGSGLGGKPYVVIRFTESSVDYEKTLAEAVRRAVARKPNVAFDLVAVTPRAKSESDMLEATKRAEDEAAAVMKSLASMGISANRVNMAAWTGQPTDVNEIRLYIR